MAKRSNTKFETTITCSKETRDILNKIKEGNENINNYDEVIQHLLKSNEGLIKENYEIILSPKVALQLETQELDKNKVPITRNRTPIYYKDLKESYVGKKYTSITATTGRYVQQEAEIVYKTDDFILLKITTVIQQDQLEQHTQLVGVELL